MQHTKGVSVQTSADSRSVSPAVMVSLLVAALTSTIMRVHGGELCQRDDHRQEGCSDVAIDLQHAAQNPKAEEAGEAKEKRSITRRYGYSDLSSNCESALHLGRLCLPNCSFPCDGNLSTDPSHLDTGEICEDESRSRQHREMVGGTTILCRARVARSAGRLTSELNHYGGNRVSTWGQRPIKPPTETIG